jgi:glycosyltransferase involved in cell wall biosynthesis
VIPARNEAQDIRATLERCLAIDYPNKEVIVVDDSTDATPQIVAEYADRGVRLIHREKNQDACCGARNVGIDAAEGDIVVLLNADAHPAPDFLSRVAEHYASGADWLVVRSRVANTETLWGEYLFAHEQVTWEGRPFDPWWSEGVSFRKRAATAVGGIPGNFPVRFCRDNMLGVEFVRAGFSKAVDASITMEHVVPDTFSSFWHHRVWRGTMFPPNFFYFRNTSIPRIALRETLKLGRTALVNLLVVPRLWSAARYARYAGGWRALPGQALAALLDDVAQTLGSWRALRELARVEGWRATPPPARV